MRFPTRLMAQCLSLDETIRDAVSGQGSVPEKWSTRKLLDHGRVAVHPRVIAWWLESKCQEVEQERLAIFRYNHVSVEYIRSLSQRQIIGYLLEVPPVFRLLHPNALE
jgi:hypothetical protein